LDRTSQELELLLLSARPALKRRRRRRALQLLADVEPAELTRRAALHGLGPQLFALLRSLKDDERTPALAELETTLKETVRATTVTDLLAGRDAFEATQALERAGIPSLVFKGPTLTPLHGAGRRDYCDVDLLVRPKDLVESRRVLLTQGYQQLTGPPEHLLSRFLPYGSELVLGQRGRTPIDLHWRLGDPGFPFALPDDRLWGHARSVPLGSGQVQTLGLEELILYLCFHGTKHLWGRLLWLADVACLLAAHEFDWDRVASLAKHTGTRRMLALGLALARDLLAVELPAPAESLANAPKTRALAADVNAALQTPSHNVWKRSAFLLRTRERRRDKARLTLDAVLRPTQYEWQALPLPAPLFPLYSVYRVARLVTKYARAPSRQ
jgi:hypothetical protein